jgi:ABC-type multidrug transport system fused ATPase/permease subunit
MTSVERINEYINTAQETGIDDEDILLGWPGQGSIEFEDYSAWYSYRDDLKPVLEGITLKVYPGEKVGVVGRTGAGKSSLAQALIRGLGFEKGRILIDGYDINHIPLKSLRESIAFIPQDPTPFSGTIRSNIDPFNEHTDHDISEILQLMGIRQPIHTSELTDAATAMSYQDSFLDLHIPIFESGTPLSRGQIQQVFLARALLRRSNVLVMDEATASIDSETEEKINAAIQSLKITIITIAHRLKTIASYDKILVLDGSKVVEFDHPYILINRGSLFQRMCRASREFDKLKETAERAYKLGGLVDYE